jgi:ChaB/Rho termination factor, N-terminal domain
MDSYDDERRANQTAWSAVKHTHEKVGDHWEPKAGGKKGPSDAQAAGGRDTGKKTKGGVDANASKDHLLKRAKELDISGRSSMKKKELVDAIQKANDKQTAKARKKE